MILEAQLEQKIVGQLSAISELSSYQILTSRQTVEDGKVIEEDDDKDGVVVVASGFRTNDNFSLPMIDVPVALQIMTRTEFDPTSQLHESVIEKIADKLSYWHKFPSPMTTALTTPKFSVGELYMSGGTGRRMDKTNKCWSETIDFKIRGSEVFTS